MNKKIAVFSTLILFAILVPPVFAKERIEIETNGYNDYISENTYTFEAADGKIRIIEYYVFGYITLTKTDGTIIDEFGYSYTVHQTTVKDNAGERLLDIFQIDMDWTDYEENGFAGSTQFITQDGENWKMHGILSGYGIYEGQTLKLDAASNLPGYYSGLLII